MNKVIKIIAILAILIFAVYWGKTIILRMLYKTDYRQYVEKYAEKYGVEKELLYAVIKVESKFDPNAISKSKAKGLMQIMDSTAKEIAQKNNIELTDENILDPEINIEIGTIYLSQLIEKYNSVELAIAAYNAGHGNVDKWISQDTLKEDGTDAENIPFKETNMYVRMMAAMELFIFQNSFFYIFSRISCINSPRLCVFYHYCTCAYHSTFPNLYIRTDECISANPCLITDTDFGTQ